MATPLYVDKIEVTAGNNASPVTVNAPTDVSDGIILEIHFYLEAGGRTIDVPGFTRKATATTGGSVHAHEVWWKRCSSESGNYSITYTGGTAFNFAYLVSYSGVITSGDPWQYAKIDFVNASAVPPAIQTFCDVSDCLMTYSVITFDGGGNPVGSYSGGNLVWTQRYTSAGAGLATAPRPNNRELENIVVQTTTPGWVSSSITVFVGALLPAVPLAAEIIARPLVPTQRMAA